MTRPSETLCIDVRNRSDVRRVARSVRAMAAGAGMEQTPVEELVLATTELATNLLKHATVGGTVTCRVLTHSAPPHIEVVVADTGPGIADVPRAMSDGFTTVGSLGSGLPSARRLTDTFQLDSHPGGTTVTLTKLLPRL